MYAYSLLVRGCTEEKVESTIGLWNEETNLSNIKFSGKKIKVFVLEKETGTVQHCYMQGIFPEGANRYLVLRVCGYGILSPRKCVQVLSPEKKLKLNCFKMYF